MVDNEEILYSSAKDAWLKAKRGIGFERIIDCLQSQGMRVADNPNQDKYPGEHVFVLEIEGYVWLVPYHEEGDKIFLKTAFPSRKANKRYARREHHEED